MTIQKIFFVIIISLCLVACVNQQPSKEEMIMINEAVDAKIDITCQLLESDGINVAVDYCENIDEINTAIGAFIINCSIAADFYKPEDKIQVSDNNITLPVSLYARAKNVLHLLDEGWKFRDVTISAFVRKKDDGFFSDPIIIKHKEI